MVRTLGSQARQPGLCNIDTGVFCSCGARQWLERPALKQDNPGCVTLTLVFSVLVGRGSG